MGETEWQKAERRHREWLSALKPGDAVAIALGWNTCYMIEQVERLTATQILLSNQARYRREDGSLLGNSSSRWGRKRLEEVTDEVRDANLRQNLLSALRGMDRRDWEALTTPGLKMVCDALVQAKAIAQESPPP